MESSDETREEGENATTNKAQAKLSRSLTDAECRFFYILMSSLLGSQILKCNPELGSESYNCRL